jgi:hypothetical protein
MPIGVPAAVARLLVLCIAILGVAMGSLCHAAAAGRVALVIGNGEYLHAPRLANPSRDADDMSAALRDLGFRVVDARDADKIALDSKLREFIDAADGADIALLYYAGHGMQIDGVNYIMPTDAKLEKRSALYFEVVNVDRVVAEMAGAAKTSLLFLDACRDNPLADQLTGQSGRSLGGERGLAPPSNSASGTLIAFSTSPGKIARDGEGRNSPFTSALLRNIRVPGLEIKTLMTRVRSDVAAATHEQQIPWDTESLRTDIFLAPGDATTPAPPPPRKDDDPCLAGIHPEAEAEEVLAADVDAGLKACAEAVIEHPDDPRMIVRLKAAKEQRAFVAAMKSSGGEAAEAYLLLYPEGRFATRARSRLAALLPPAEAPIPRPARPDTEMLMRDSEALFARYTEISNDRLEDGSGLEQFYAGNVNFYGTLMSRDEIIRQKSSYFKTWNLRRYAVETEQAQCEGRVCALNGSMSWSLRSDARRMQSTGRSTFSCTVDWSSGQGKIIAESGAVISREAHKY